MIYIQSNGSKWYGQEPDTVETLVEVLKNHQLDTDRFKQFYTLTTPAYFLRPNECQHLIGTTHFRGNFVDVSHVFSIYTDEPEVIKVLTKAIKGNLKKFKEDSK